MNQEEQNWKFNSYKQLLEEIIKDSVNKWEDDRENSWKSELALNGICSELAEDMDNIDIPFEKEEAFARIEEFADAIFYSACNIGKHSPIDDIGISSEDYYSYPKFISFVKEKLGIHLAKQIVSKLSIARERILDLENELMLWGRIKLQSEVLMRFLNLIKESYIWGFDAQCIIICRSAIEDALRSKISYEILEKHFGVSRTKNLYSLNDYIAAAKLKGLLDEQAADEADKIRIRANSIIHKDPNLTNNTFSMIFHTTSILYMIDTGKPRIDL